MHICLTVHRVRDWAGLIVASVVIASLVKAPKNTD